MSPLIILLIGIILVVAMIVVLKVNAFVSLITSAMVISLLAPGNLDDKIARVAREFGSVAAALTGCGILIISMLFAWLLPLV
jgi:GntP family gluconate:H+ symporter